MDTYGIQFYHQYYDKGGFLNRIEILQKEYSGTVQFPINYMAEIPVYLSHMDEDKDTFDDVIIQAQSLSFTFYVSREEIPVFDVLFISEYRDYKVRYYVNSVLEFEGYLQPDNLIKEYSRNPPYIGISVTATDALNELKDIEFRDDSEKIIRGKMTLLEVLKQALSKTGIELDFEIQLNTYHGPYVPNTETWDYLLATESPIPEEDNNYLVTEYGELIVIEEYLL